MKSLLLVGCGNMGGAMLAGWLAGGFDPARVTIIDPQLAEAPARTRLLRDASELTPAAADARFDAVLFGVKPQMLDAVAPNVAPLTAGAILLSILAGVELETLARRFPDAAGHVRVMPNLAAAIGKSPIALVGRGLDPVEAEAVTDLMAPLGAPEWLADESLFDLVTALAGSGPGFVYRFIDALASGAAALGLPADQAQRLAIATVEGASLLAAASPHAPAELARRVASPGGTTQAGLDVLDRDRALAGLVEATLAAARDRGAEMARAARDAM